MSLWILVLGLVIVLIIYYLQSSRVQRPYLWTYWENRGTRTSPPAHIQLCLESIHRRCANTFQVVTLDAQSISRYLPNLRSDLDKLLVAQKVDYIRVALLEKYGGVWVDADTIMLSDLRDLADKLQRHDFIGYGCTGDKCYYGKPRPSNWVLASKAKGQLITRVLASLDQHLDSGQSNFSYHDLGKKVIWQELARLQSTGYDYYHYPADYDGSRDAGGKWIHSPQHLSTTPIVFLNSEKLQFSFLSNAELMGNEKYQWVLQKSRDELLRGPWNMSRLFRRAFGVVEKNVSPS